jgi:outer membrane protein assembly factor BamB
MAKTTSVEKPTNFPASIASLTLPAKEFAMATEHEMRFDLANNAAGVLHIKMAPAAAWLGVYPEEVALAEGEKQPILVRINLTKARESLQGGGNYVAPISIAYQTLIKGVTDTASHTGEVYVRLPVAICPSCQTSVDTNLKDGLQIPDQCPNCYERLRPCPVCGTPNSWLAAVCIADNNHIIRTSPNWPMLGGNAAHTGFHPQKSPAALFKRWTYPLNAPKGEEALAWSAPVAAYGMVVAAAATPSGEAEIHAFDAIKGSPIWEPFPLPDPIYPERGGVCVAAGRVFAATVEGTVIALDILRGTRIWETKIEGRVFGSIITVSESGPLLIPLSYGEKKKGGLAVVDTATGNLINTIPLPGASDTTPTVYNNIAYAHDDSGALTAIEITTGKILWQKIRKTDFDSSPIAIGSLENDERVYSAGMDGTVCAYDTQTGEEIWQVDVTTGPFPGTPASDGTLLYLPAHDGLHVINAATGKAIRRHSAPRPVRSSPVLLDGAIFFAVSDGNVYGMETGKSPERIYETGSYGSQIIAAPAVGEKTYFVAATNGVLYALGF